MKAPTDSAQISAATKIVVTERSDDFHAQIEGDPFRWEAGKTIREAVRQIRISFPELQTAEILFRPLPYSRV